MRQGTRNWEEEYSKTLTDARFVVGRAKGSTFYHEMREVRIVVHGDDFVITGREEELKEEIPFQDARHPRARAKRQQGSHHLQPLLMWKRFWKLHGWLTAGRTPYWQRNRSTQYHWRESSAKRTGRRWRELTTFRRTVQTFASRQKNMPEDGKPHSSALEWAEEVVPVPPRKAKAGTRTC